MSKIAVLGAGMVGRTIAVDLCNQGHEITSFDISQNNLNTLLNFDSSIKINLVDFTAMNYENGLASFDLVVSAVPGFIGYRVLKNIIEGAKKDCIDISFFPEDFTPLHQSAIENRVMAIVDCGVAPGMSNLILGYESLKRNIIDFKFYVGGIPQERTLPFEYKAPFSPIDVIEEYTRPVRMRTNGNDIVVEPLTDIEHIEVTDVGTLEGFNTDGLRSLLTSFPDIPNMSEKTLRYPGYADKIKLLKQMGFFKYPHINHTADVLKEAWLMKPEDKDITYMKVEIVDTKNKMITYDMIDYHDGEFSSMSRTTAYTCTAIVNLFLNRHIKQFGVYPPEYIGQSMSNFNYIINYLHDKNVKWTCYEI